MNKIIIASSTGITARIAKVIFECKSKDYKIIFSSGKTPGEGEHKILDFIRERDEEDLSGPYVIYGLDADLIFLSLALNHSDIYLMREDMHFNRDGGEILNYVDLEVMKRSIINTMNLYVDDLERKPDEIYLINDFIFVSYFLGNDFLPHNACLDIYNDALGLLLKVYGEMINKTKLPIINYNRLKDKNFKINQKGLIEFIRILSEMEDELMKMIPNKKKRHYPSCGSKYEMEWSRIENLRFRINDPVKLGVDDYEEYRKRYYKHYFNIDVEENNDDIVKICYEYLKGLVWVSKYYFVGLPSWDYYYYYDQCPFMGDLIKIAGLIDLDKLKFKKGRPVNALEQLLTVLPPQADYLLPKSLRFLFKEDSKLGHLYPDNFEQDLLYKHKYWQGIPLLPSLEIKLVKEVFKENKKRLKKSDLEKLEIKKEFVYNE